MFLLRAALPLPPPATATTAKATARFWRGMPATGRSRKRALVVPAAGRGGRTGDFCFNFNFYFDLFCCCC